MGKRESISLTAQIVAGETPEVPGIRFFICMWGYIMSGTAEALIGTGIVRAAWFDVGTKQGRKSKFFDAEGREILVKRAGKKTWEVWVSFTDEEEAKVEAIGGIKRFETMERFRHYGPRLEDRLRRRYGLACSATVEACRDGSYWQNICIQGTREQLLKTGLATDALFDNFGKRRSKRRFSAGCGTRVYLYETESVGVWSLRVITDENPDERLTLEVQRVAARALRAIFHMQGREAAT